MLDETIETDFHRLGGCGGLTLFPNIFGLSIPLTARIWSRITSESSRNLEPRASSRLSGSLPNSAGVARDDWRYVRVMSIDLTNALTSQPDRANCKLR